jgi:hypothetical protein
MCQEPSSVEKPLFSIIAVLFNKVNRFSKGYVICSLIMCTGMPSAPSRVIYYIEEMKGIIRLDEATVIALYVQGNINTFTGIVDCYQELLVRYLF